MKPHIRFFIRSDMPEVLAIERRSYDSHWTEEDFLTKLRQRNCIGMVAEHGDIIVGFMVYELMKTRIHVLNLAVDPIYCRQSVGSAMVENLKSKLSVRRAGLTFITRESNLAAAIFLRSQGFRAILAPKFWEDTGEDAYSFDYTHVEVPKIVQQVRQLYSA